MMLFVLEGLAGCRTPGNPNIPSGRFITPAGREPWSRVGMQGSNADVRMRDKKATAGKMRVRSYQPKGQLPPILALVPLHEIRQIINKAVRRWGTSRSLRYDGAIPMPGSSTQASRANQA
jgi:hypothetical protein